MGRAIRDAGMLGIINTVLATVGLLASCVSAYHAMENRALLTQARLELVQALKEAQEFNYRTFATRAELELVRQADRAQHDRKGEDTR